MKTILLIACAMAFAVASSAAKAADVVLTWTDNSTTETNFEIERAVQATPPVFNKVGTVPTNTVTFTDPAVPASTTLLYRVRATNAGGSSGYSNTATITTPIPPPADPSGLVPVLKLTMLLEMPAGTKINAMMVTDNTAIEEGKKFAATPLSDKYIPKVVPIVKVTE